MGPVFPVLLYDGASRWLADAVLVWLGPGIPPAGVPLSALLRQGGQFSIQIGAVADDPAMPAIPTPFPDNAPSQPPQITDRPPPPMPPAP